MQRVDWSLYSMNPGEFFTPAFLNAIHDGSEGAICSIVTELFPGIYEFEIFRRDFCQRLIEESDLMENWVFHTRSDPIRAASAPRESGLVLSDFGMKSMLNQMMRDYIRPVAAVLFPEFGGASLDRQQSFALMYGYIGYPEG
uniref:Uncharacterized protein n=1 Tax=Kalanchoe fedtschenkoi TaxID=63787 RepID=A0A7N1A497_KALFE